MSSRRPAAPKRTAPGPAKTSPPLDSAAALAQSLSREVERALEAGRTDVLPPEAVQALMAAACRLYSAQVEVGGNDLPLAKGAPVSATDVMRTASGLLRAADLQVFELGMWVSYTGR
jgi:hypothetical protein